MVPVSGRPNSARSLFEGALACEGVEARRRVLSASADFDLGVGGVVVMMHDAVEGVPFGKPMRVFAKFTFSSICAARVQRPFHHAIVVSHSLAFASVMTLPSGSSKEAKKISENVRLNSIPPVRSCS